MHIYGVNEYWFREIGEMFEVSELGRLLQVLPIKLTSDGPWIAGGAVRRAAMGEDFGKDVDFFFRDEDQFNACRNKMTSIFNDPRWEELRGEETTRRVMFKFAAWPKLDFVRGTYFRNPQELFADFDFTCCCFATDGSTLWVGEYALLHAANKAIRVNNIDKIGASLDHMERLLREGFTADKRCLDELLRYGREERNKAKIAYSGPHNIPVQE